MSVTWTIRRASGEERTLAAWGIEGLTRTLQNLDVDFCSVSMARGGITEAMPFEVDEELRVFRDGVQWFAGACRRERPDATGAAHEGTFRIDGPSRWIDELTYRQWWRFADWPIKFTGTVPNAVDPDNPWKSVGLTYNEVVANLSVARDVMQYKTGKKLSSVTLLGQDDEGEFIRTDESIRAVLNFAISQGAPMQLGTVDNGVKMPVDQIRDMTCMQVIRRLLQWTPDMGSWWDYSSTPPTLHVRKRGNRGVTTFTVGVDGVEGVALEARRDLQVRGVMIQYLRESTYSGLTLYSMERDGVGEQDGLGVLYATVELSGEAMMDAEGTIFRAGMPTPEGVAQALYDGYGWLQWAGELRLVDEDVGGTNYLSRRVNVAGGRREWESMEGVVQQQVDDVFMGRTTLRLGPPAHLSPQDFVARLQASRGLRPVPRAMSDARTDGGAASPAMPAPAPGVPPKMVFGDNKVDLVIYCHFHSNCISPWFNLTNYTDDQVYFNNGTAEVFVTRARWHGHGQTLTYRGIRIGFIHDYKGTEGVCDPGPHHAIVYVIQTDNTWITRQWIDNGCSNC